MTSTRREAGSSEQASNQPKRRTSEPEAAQSAAGEPLPVEVVEAPVQATQLQVAQQHAPPPLAPPTLLVASKTVVVPTAERPAPVSRPPVRRFSPPPILVASAEPALARMLSFALEQLRLPYRLLESGPAVLREMLEMRLTSQPPIVLLDVDLPGVDGHAILERVGVKRPDAFLIIVLSSHADESVQVRSLLAGAVDHLAKPFNVRVLMAKIQRWTAMAAHLAGAA